MRGGEGTGEVSISRTLGPPWTVQPDGEEEAETTSYLLIPPVQVLPVF